jgi:uncharacterized protein YceK
MRLVLTSIAATLMLSGCANAQQTADSPTPIVGGWSNAEVTPDVTKAAAFALGELKIPADRLDRIENVQRQVVAGTNYRFAIVLKDKHQWRVTVWSKLDGSYELTAREEVHAH